MATVPCRPRSRPRDSTWPVICVLALVVASDFTFRRRPDVLAVQGKPDFFVMLEVASYAAVGGWLLWRCRPRPVLRRASWPVCAAYGYAIVLAVSALYSPYHGLALVRGGQVLVVLALSRAIARHGAPGAVHRIAHGYAALIAASVVFGVLVPFPRLPSQQGRFTWLYIHPVQAGALCSIAVVLLVGYLVTRGMHRDGPQWPVPAYALLLVVCGGGLLATHTRSAVAGALAGAVLLVVLRWRGMRRVETVTVLCLIAAGAALAGSDRIAAFFARGESWQQLATLNSRTELWAQAWHDFLRQPLYGYGLSATRGLFLDTIGLGGGHNAIVNLLVNNGIAGVAVWLALLSGIVVVAMRCGRVTGLRASGMLVLAVLLCMFLDSVFTEGLGAPANVMCTWLFVLSAWLGMMRRQQLDPATTGIGAEKVVA